MGGARRRVPRSVPYIWVAKVREFRRPRSVGKGKRGEKNEENREHGSEITVTMDRKGRERKIEDASRYGRLPLKCGAHASRRREGRGEGMRKRERNSRSRTESNKINRPVETRRADRKTGEKMVEPRHLAPSGLQNAVSEGRTCRTIGHENTWPRPPYVLGAQNSGR